MKQAQHNSEKKKKGKRGGSFGTPHFLRWIFGVNYFREGVGKTNQKNLQLYERHLRALKHVHGEARTLT